VLEISYLAAFLGGVLSLLSPCSALLLPAFFAYAFQSRKDLLAKTAVFYFGLAATLVPLGMGISAVSRLVYGERNTLIVVSGAVIIFLGVLQLLGRGFKLPGPLSRMRGMVRGETTGATFALGAVYGFAGFCSGPILGAVLTVAASSGQVFRGAVLLAIYALGMAAPLFLMATLWERFDLGRRSWLRGRELSIGGLQVHTINLVAGVMFILLGVIFIAYEWTSALSGLYEAYGAEEVAFAAEQWVRSFSGGVPDALVLTGALAAALVLAGMVFVRRRSKLRGSTGTNGSAKRFADEKQSDKANR
jgi:cytochrome c biogenesis protein CcdA